MPIRIYALAKELKIDNKILVDICTKAGITGKGSALASLTDEEVAKLKAFMSAGRGSRGGAASAASRDAAAEPSVLRREDYIAPAGTHGGKIPVLPPKIDKPPVLKKKPVTEKPPEEKPVENSLPPARVSKPAKLKKTGKKPAEATPPEELKKPEDYRLPEETKAGGCEPVTEAARQPAKRAKQEKEKKEREKDRERSTRGIKFAPLPASKARGKAKPKEPAPQKPDIRLPRDAIRAGKAGGKPLSEHLRKAEQKRKAAEPKHGLLAELPPDLTIPPMRIASAGPGTPPRRIARRNRRDGRRRSAHAGRPRAAAAEAEKNGHRTPPNRR